MPIDKTLHNNEVIQSLRLDRNNDRSLLFCQILQRHIAEAFCAVSSRLCEVLEVQQGESSASPHMIRIQTMQKPNHYRRLRRVVLKVISQQSAQRSCTAAHIPA